MSADDPDWNERRNALWMTLWKIESKVEDLKLKLNKFLDDVRSQMRSAPCVEKPFLRWTQEGRTKFIALMKGVDGLFQDFYTNEISQLKTYSKKIERMTGRVKEELDKYLQPQVVDSGTLPTRREMDPALSLDIILEFHLETIILNLKVHRAISDYHTVVVEFKEFYLRLHNTYVKLIQRELILSLKLILKQRDRQILLLKRLNGSANAGPQPRKKRKIA
jgi:hypothetical protein